MTSAESVPLIPRKIRPFLAFTSRRIGSMMLPKIVPEAAVNRALMALAALAVWVGSIPFAAELENDPHFHHFHLNVVDPQKSIEFYQRIFGAVPIKFGGRTDAAFT